MTERQTSPNSATWTADKVRRTFIDFFRSKPTATDGHTFFPSSPVVPHDDPTLLFTNAGMNQFKPIFLGQADPNSDLGRLKRAANSQKCIRAGGKHNDLEDVGKDTYHHTFFEMLGNWSFGDYFKAEAIEWAWELLTGVYGIDPERLYATYFGGDQGANLAPDDEARRLWLRFLPAERVLPFGMKDNFWEMGDTGPCGPCSEIHYDRVGGRDAAGLINADDPNVIEIWNLVFIQFNRESADSLKPLPARHVDTGMGLERLCSILQHTTSNYDTDLFTPIFAAIELFTKGRHQYLGRVGDADPQRVDMAFRVIADHIRTLTFALTDGAVPSNDGRGYVLRRILRRAVRFGRQMLDAPTGFFANLVPVVVDTMGDAFPELRRDPDAVRQIIREEEESFGRTLDRGIKLFDEAYRRAFARVYVPRLVPFGSPSLNQEEELSAAIRGWEDGKSARIWAGQPQISGEDAFQLYDTFGFPLDLTRLMAEERRIGVDEAAFERLMEEQRERSRAAAKFGGPGEQLTLQPETIARLAHLGIRPTDDIDKFHGRDIRATVKAIWNGHNFDQTSRAAARNQPVGLILDKTNFYAEMGGQVADLGRIFVTREIRSSASDKHDGGEFRVEDVQSFGPYILHIGHVVRGEMRVGDDVQMCIDHARRNAVASNHTATHLVNLALRRVLERDADQRGSLVAPDRLRFDFAHNKAVTTDELGKVERQVRDLIGQDLTVHADTAPLYLARSIKGLRAVFGETYPDPVRVVSVGVPVQDLLDNPEDDKWPRFSVEFCGGTHVESTAHIGDFALTGEEAVAKGIRRVVALTGAPAAQAIKAADDLQRRIDTLKSADDKTLSGAIQDLTRDVDESTLPAARKHALRTAVGELLDRVKTAQKRAAAGRAKEAVATALQIGQAAAAELDNEVIIQTLDTGSDRKALQQALSVIRDLCPKSAVMLLSPDEQEGKVAIIAGVPENLIKRGLKAGDWVRAAAEQCGGKGGGRPDQAQGGGTDVSKVRQAAREAETFAHRAIR